MIHKLLLAYDGSDSAKHAFEFALDLALHYQCEFHVVAVAQPPDFGTEGETEAIVEHSLKHFRRMLQELKAQLPPGFPQAVYFEALVGHPAERIVHYAERNLIDHIVVGHRGHTLFERWLIGSVARRIIGYAHCGVTVVR